MLCYKKYYLGHIDLPPIYAIHPSVIPTEHWNHPTLAFPGDVMVARADGQPHVAGNFVKPPQESATPRDKVQRTASELSMLAAPTLILGSESQTPATPTPMLNDAQSRQYSPPAPTPPRLENGIVFPTPSGSLGTLEKKLKKSPAPCGSSKYDKYYHQTLVQI